MKTKTQQIRAERRAAAEARQAEYNKLSLAEKLAKLPENGAKKQRAKLLALMEKEKNKNAEATETLVASEKTEKSPKISKKKGKNK